MIKFKTDNIRWGIEAKITPVEVDKETDTSVWIGGRRAYKVSNYEVYHDTWRNAHAYLLSNANVHAKVAQRNLEVANSNLGNVKGMKEPA